MASQLPNIHLILFTCLLTIAAATTSLEPIAKPNCSTHCGTIQIPFPFGIETGCYIHEWFRITCTKNDTVPILLRADLEVTSISLAGTLTVRTPIAFSGCTDKPNVNLTAADLTGSPFLYSPRNRFTAVSCGAIALMSSSSDGAAIAGCLSICAAAGPTAMNKSCNGMECCQTTIPSSLAAFNTTFRAIDDGSESESDHRQCKYAFLADQEWFEARTTDIASVQEMSDVPVVLEWELRNSTREVFGRDVKTNVSERDRYFYPGYFWDEDMDNSVGYVNSSCRSFVTASSAAVNRSRLECRCPEGYAGNPYLDKGCRDINECEGVHMRCAPGAHCLNYNGFYSCYLPLRKRSRSKEILIGVGSSVGPLLLLVVAFLSYKLIVRRRDKQRKKIFFERNGGMLLQQQLSSGETNVEKTKLFDSKELEKATDHFNANRILGQGGQGTVYKGMLEDGKIVAVKKSKIIDEGKLQEFINEVVILSQINHRNVVKLLGCCLETEVPLLVYEYIPNGTLSHYILGHTNEDFPLSWEIRVRIASEIAGALAYLHSSASLPIYHRDIKSTNILLDDKYRAKVADFGTSRSVAIDQTHLTTKVRGTFGYLDPEYFQSSKFTDKSDVYSFGVVLVELLTGQKPISMDRTEEPRSLVTYFMACIEEDRLFDIVDAQVAKEGEREDIVVFANLSKRCLSLKGKRRPMMKEVSTALEDLRKSINSSSNINGQFSFNKDCIDDARDHVIKNWDVVSSSTWSSSYGENSTGSSYEGRPLLSK